MSNEIKIGDTVRFECYKMDDWGRITEKQMKVTGVLIGIEPKCSETNFPKYWVRRNGEDYWYSGDELILIKSRKINHERKNKHSIDGVERKVKPKVSRFT